MPTYTLIAPAKINLLLEIIGDRPDGFHELVMVLQSIDLADIIELKALPGDQIQLNCSHPDVPLDPSNLAHRAAKLMQTQFPDRGGVEITIQKHIPIGAGLAGGSADAAAVLVGLDLMWNLGLTQAELQTLGAALGSDIPFCVSGGTALALGRGENLTPLPDLHQLYAVLAKYRSLSVSTPWAYKTYRQKFGDTYAKTPEAQEQRRREGPSVPLLTAVNHRDHEQIPKYLYNDLERVVLPEHPQVLALREKFQQLGCLGTMMSGSGPTVFALMDSREEAQLLKTKLEVAVADPDLDLWVTQFCCSGIQLQTT
ncbi:MAG: 4-(cytidine 5'-diphospho)-2-C-methyl-D-erythritol kinase [Cyanobacteria bacterium P01_A01_bin.17]